MCGDKKKVLKDMPVADLLEAGISVASSNYRLSVTAPYPAPMFDAARAIQYIRSHAGKWNVDPQRIATSGGSSGGGISLWLAFHKDMAKPDAEDPVEHHSTRMICAVGLWAQCSYDPREIRKIVPGMAYDNKCLKYFFGVPPETDWDTFPVDAELDALMKDASPLTHLTADAPAVYLLHLANQEQDGNIHHANFGRHLEDAMKNLGIECMRRIDREYTSLGTTFHQECVEFLLRQFGMGRKN